MQLYKKYNITSSTLSTIYKGNNKITELRTIFQRENKNSSVYKQTKSVSNRKTGKPVMTQTWYRHFQRNGWLNQILRRHTTRFIIDRNRRSLRSISIQRSLLVVVMGQNDSTTVVLTVATVEKNPEAVIWSIIIVSNDYFLLTAK